MAALGLKRSLAHLLNKRPLMGVDEAARNDRDGWKVVISGHRRG